ncbi:amidohydrolase family protein [Steroidobacter sp.]|uniref:amidohydrolase family protein n=1 Tax=Steroidobacter sp. TaxID=1978227 RepID=UPI001A566C08|nr:amidohydrolase family protein [Steroidobacter sp.]MBL8272061.1 amidohydrolase family protein [Steroidobacter sp.]
MKLNSLWLVALLLASVVAVAAEQPPYRASDFAAVEKVDTHVHLHGALPTFMLRAAADNFRLLTINVNYSDFPPLSQQRSDALALRLAHPDRVAFAATFDATDSQRTGWATQTERQLDDAFKEGAVAVKVWKDIGMQQRDADGRAVMIDDARFTPILRMLEERGAVLLGHLGEPRNAWLPVAEMTIRSDREYFTTHPQYHMHSHPEWPTYEQQIAARDRMLDAHPKLHFVGVHLASLEWSIERTAEFLQRYPNASVDLAARLSHVQRQASVDRDRVRRFFIDFQDRILYATDIACQGPQEDSACAAEAHETWLSDWRFLSSADRLHSDEFEASFRGLSLPRDVIDKIYNGNARKLFPTAWAKAQ